MGNENEIAATYTANENNVSLDFGSNGIIEVELNEGVTQLTVKNRTGDFVHYMPEEAVFNEMNVLDNAESYTESGVMYYQKTSKKQRSGARGAYYCDYYDGNGGSEIGGSGWSLMGGNGDQLSLETNPAYVHSGNNSLKMKRNMGNSMRYSTWGLHDGSAKGYEKVNYFMFYVKNPNAEPLTLRISVYSQKQVTPASQTNDRAFLEKVVEANSDWVRVVMPLDAAKTYYGVAFTALNVSGKSGTDYFYVDDQVFFSEEMNIAATIGVRKGLELSGDIVAGPATITFKELGKAKLSCAALGKDVEVTFTLIGNELTVKIPKISDEIAATTLVGTYARFNNKGGVRYTITSVTGGLENYIQVNTALEGSLALTDEGQD